MESAPSAISEYPKRAATSAIKRQITDHLSMTMLFKILKISLLFCESYHQKYQSQNQGHDQKYAKTHACFEYACGEVA